MAQIYWNRVYSLSPLGSMIAQIASNYLWVQTFSKVVDSTYLPCSLQSRKIPVYSPLSVACLLQKARSLGSRRRRWQWLASTSTRIACTSKSSTISSARAAPHLSYLSNQTASWARNLIKYMYLAWYTSTAPLFQVIGLASYSSSDEKPCETRHTSNCNFMGAAPCNQTIWERTGLLPCLILLLLAVNQLWA